VSVKGDTKPLENISKDTPGEGYTSPTHFLMDKNGEIEGLVLDNLKIDDDPEKFI